MKHVRNKLICIKCSTDEKNNPSLKDIEFKPLEDETMIVDYDHGIYYEMWECPKCGYQLWLKPTYEEPLAEIQN